MNDNIAKVAISAYNELSPEMREACAKHDYFVTKVRAKVDEIAYTVDGVLHKPKPQYHTLIDFEKPMIHDDWGAYQKHSMELYTLFKTIEDRGKFYEC